METWKPVPVPGFEHYEVSDLGRTRNTRASRTTTAGHILAARPHVRTGYIFIKMKANGEQGTFYVHRLVALAFIPNPDGKPEVNHKDFNKSNNAASNLEWVTGAENNAHAEANGHNGGHNALTPAQQARHRARHREAMQKRITLTAEQVMSLRSEFLASAHPVMEFCRTEAARLGCTDITVFKALRGQGAYAAVPGALPLKYSGRGGPGRKRKLPVAAD